jgi:FdhD protein
MRDPGNDLPTHAVAMPGRRRTYAAGVGRITDRRRLLQVRGAARGERVDTLVVEEPLEIRYAGRPLAVTMRTPGDDFDLVAGFLVSEGVIASAAEVRSLRYCAPPGTDADAAYNHVEVVLADGVPAPQASVERAFTTTSACGICGKAELDAVRTRTRWPVAADPARVTTELLTALPDRLRAGQAVFERTGGLHAAALFTADGSLICLREDVGRHNAVDKVIGWALREDRLPLRGCVLQVSGRASFELVQKAVMAGVPVLAAVSAPSTLAVDLATDAGLTLVGFLRGDSMNVYSGAHRITLTVPLSRPSGTAAPQPPR